MAKKLFRLPPPTLQINFAHRLVAIKQTHLQPALLSVVANLDIAELDRQLAIAAPKSALQRLAAVGLRGELLFAPSVVLQARPALLTYYRTLLGYSQKEFYKTGTGLSVFRRVEDGLPLSVTAMDGLDELCSQMNEQACNLLLGIDGLQLTSNLFSELSLLSVGPQLRGGNNNKRGESGIDQLFAVILSAVAHVKPLVSKKAISFTNASKRKIIIEIAADPDVVIKEEISSQTSRPLVAIEVKAGTDASNIHNRIGEAEKSHLKAKDQKFTEFWTVVNVDALDLLVAHQQSPTTNRFFKLSALINEAAPERQEFVESIVALVGIKAKPILKSGKTK